MKWHTNDTKFSTHEIKLCYIKSFWSTSAGCLADGICWTVIFIVHTLSCMKCISISTCFVPAWRKGLKAKTTRFKLSQQIIGTNGKVIHISFSKCLSHIISVIVVVNVLYSTSVLDRVITSYILEQHMIGLELRKMHTPIRDLQSSHDPLKLASTNPMRRRWE